MGLGIAQCMAKAGAKVVLVGRREPELKSAVSTIGASASYVSADITQLDRAPCASASAAQAGSLDEQTTLSADAAHALGGSKGPRQA